jgi:hypothetical protein
MVANPHRQEQTHHHDGQQKEVGALLEPALKERSDIQLDLTLRERGRNGVAAGR